VVVGEGTPQFASHSPFRWTAAGGLRELGFFPGYNNFTAATGVSGDGSIVVGTGPSDSGLQAFRWTAAGGIRGLGELPGGPSMSEALAISAGGSTIVGASFSEPGVEAFRWTEAGGMVGLGDLPGGGFHSVARAASADGSVVVGSATSDNPVFPSAGEAFIWTADGGMRSLRDVLVEDHGLDLTGWRLTAANGISADGRTIVGDGLHVSGSSFLGWVAVVPEPSLLVPAALSGAAALMRRRPRRATPRQGG
jgi:probable HAF family extracellular repeat protein